MNEISPPTWFIPVAFAWIVIVVGASIVFRRRSGKPIFPKAPGNALYVDRSASGRWASNCLLVTVTDEAVSVVPKFPFNLMFLPEIYKLERTIPVASFRQVKRLRSFGLGNNVSIDYADARLPLKVREPDAFIAALAHPWVVVPK